MLLEYIKEKLAILQENIGEHKVASSSQGVHLRIGCIREGSVQKRASKGTSGNRGM
jgi:hypothetical protein